MTEKELTESTEKITTDTDNHLSDTDTRRPKFFLTQKNWTAFNFKFAIAAKKHRYWTVIDPDGDPLKNTRDSTAVKTAALEILIDYLHDDIIWIITNCSDPPRILVNATKHYAPNWVIPERIPKLKSRN
jgi:hypothetical protein